MLLLLLVWVMIAKKTYIFKSLDAPKQIMGWLQLDLDLGGGHWRSSFEGRVDSEAGV